MTRDNYDKLVITEIIPDKLDLIDKRLTELESIINNFSKPFIQGLSGAANYLEVSVGTIKKFVKIGYITPIKYTSKILYFLRSDLDELALKRKIRK